MLLLHLPVAVVRLGSSLCLKQLGPSHQHVVPLLCTTAKTPNCHGLLPGLPEAFSDPFCSFVLFLVLQLYAAFYGCVGCKQQMYLKCVGVQTARCYTGNRK